MSQIPLILIGGPTASGKSALALRLAKERNGSIVNADAMQVYAGLPILTAQPAPCEKAEIPHYLYETTDPSESSSAGKWLAQARTAIDQIRSRNRTPILVGGTGLYFDALMGGLADIPPIPPETRQRAIDLYASLGEPAFRQALSMRDPSIASRIAPNDKQRLIRAYEVFEHTGKPLSEWQKVREKTLQSEKAEYHLLLPERDKLYEACDKRFIDMIRRGAVDEARAFLDRGLPPSLPSMKIIGLRELAAFIRGEAGLEACIAKAQQVTRNYAKRQTTWFRNRWQKTALFGKESVNAAPV